MRFLNVTFLTVAIVALMVAGGASSAFASDPTESELQRLIPGVALEEDELGAMYGMGSVSSSSGAEISSISAGSDLRLRARIRRARGSAISVPRPTSARNAARRAFGGVQLPRVSASVDGEDVFFSDFTIGF